MFHKRPPTSSRPGSQALRRRGKCNAPMPASTATRGSPGWKRRKPQSQPGIHPTKLHDSTKRIAGKPASTSAARRCPRLHRKIVPKTARTMPGNAHSSPRPGLKSAYGNPTQGGVVHESDPYPKSNGDPNLAQLTRSVTTTALIHAPSGTKIRHGLRRNSEVRRVTTAGTRSEPSRGRKIG